MTTWVASAELLRALVAPHRDEQREQFTGPILLNAEQLVGRDRFLRCWFCAAAVLDNSISSAGVFKHWHVLAKAEARASHCNGLVCCVGLGCGHAGLAKLQAEGWGRLGQRRAGADDCAHLVVAWPADDLVALCACAVLRHDPLRATVAHGARLGQAFVDHRHVRIQHDGSALLAVHVATVASVQDCGLKGVGA